MALTPGSRLGAYDITDQIGEGGMGQVRGTPPSTVPSVPGGALSPISYAVGDDGKRFLISIGDGTGSAPPLTVMLNWRAGVQK